MHLIRARATKFLCVCFLYLIVGCDSNTNIEEPAKPNLIRENHPPRPVHTQHRFAEVRAGNRFACGLTKSNELWCWAGGSSYLLGTETDEDYTGDAVKVDIDEPIVSFDTGYNHSCALTESGDVYCWGAGRAAVGASPSAPYGSLPNKIDTSLRFTSLRAGEGFACGITAAGKIHCWGSFVEFGLGASRTSATPLLVYDGDAEQMSLASAIWCSGWALTQTEELIAWGCRSDDLSPHGIDAPEQFVQIEKGGGHVCGLTQSGDVYCAGKNGSAQAGPVLDFSFTTSTRYTFEWQQIPAAASFVQITAGEDHTCGLTAEGQVYCWGLNEQTQLGSSFYEICETPYTCFYDSFLGSNCASSEIPCIRTPRRVDLDEAFISITTGTDATYGLTEDGRLFKWGGRTPLY